MNPARQKAAQWLIQQYSDPWGTELPTVMVFLSQGSQPLGTRVTLA